MRSTQIRRASSLPPFRPVTQEELKRAWFDNNDPDIRRMALEIARYREVIGEVDVLFQSVHEVWKVEIGGSMVAIHLLRQVLSEERERVCLPKTGE